MKAKIMALILAVVLGTAGIAATAQAATGAASECTHSKYKWLYDDDYCIYYSPQYHLKIHIDEYICTVCGDRFSKETQEYEWHDYEQTYLDDGRVFTRCTGCDDSYYY